MTNHKYIIEYWKAGLPHKKVVRYAPHVTAIKRIEYIYAWSYKVIIWRDGKIVTTYNN